MTIRTCVENCQRKTSFISGSCELHNCPKVFSCCLRCTPNFTVRTLDPSLVCTPPINYIQTIFSVRDGNIVLNLFDIFNESDGFSYTNVIDGRDAMIHGSNALPGVNGPMVGGQRANARHGPTNIIKKIENTPTEVRYFISPPPQNIHVEPYLNHNKEAIYSQIKASNHLSPWDTYKVYISCFSKYYKRNSENQSEFGGMYNSSRHDVLPAGSEALDNDYLQYVINSLGDVQTQQQGSMRDSNWIYMGTAQIAIVFFKMIGKPIQIKEWEPYKGRGRDSIINVNNTRPQNRITNISPCVVIAIRCHKYLHDHTNTQYKEYDMSKLRGNRGGKRISKEIWHRLRQYPVSLPRESVVTGAFTMDHFSGLEKANSIPIAVHFLKKGQTKEGGLNIECIRAPSNNTIRTYIDSEICHLLMISPFHVCYIPDITQYLKIAFKSKSKHRCYFCYIAFNSQFNLVDHLRDGGCHLESNFVPTTMLLEEGAYIPHKNLINEMVPELSIICDAEAFTSSPSTSHSNDDVTNSDVINSDSDDDELDTDIFNLPDQQLQNERPPGPTSKHVINSLAYMSVDHEYKMIEYRQDWGLDCAHRMLDRLEGMIKAFHTIYQPKKYIRPELSPQDWRDFHNSTHCAYCGKDYASMPHKLKHRHHNHYKAPVYGTPKMLACGRLHHPVITGNYINSSCAVCNWKLSNKRRTVYVWMHNFSGYDGALLIEGLLASRMNDLKSFSILPKGATGYHFIQYNNIRFLDSLSFLQGSLSSIVQLEAKKIDWNLPDKIDAMSKVFPNTVEAVKRSEFNDDVIPLLTHKLVYPYSLPKKMEDFTDINYFPEPAAFRDELNDRDIDPQDYENGEIIYNVSGCKNLKQMHELYLLTDVCFLSDVWRSYNQETFKTFGLHASNFISGPALSFAAGLKESKTDIHLLTDQSMYTLFSNSIRGGYCATNVRYCKANNVDMGSDFDPSKPSSSILFLDWNGLYSECLSQPMPYANFKYADKDFISYYENDPQLLMQLNTDKDQGYFITCDYDIPQDLARFTDCMPLSIINTTKISPSEYTKSVGGKNASQKKLIAGHFSLQKYSFDLRLLKLYISLGVAVTKIHSIIIFDQKPLFKPFIDKCADGRRQATLDNDPNKKRQCKLHPNCLYGKCCQNDVYHNHKTVITKNDEHYRKLVSSHRFKSRRWLVKDKIVLVTLVKPKVKVRTPIFIAACVLQLAKLKNLSFVHLVLQPSCADFDGLTTLRGSDLALIIQSRRFIKAIRVIYTDTDSILIEIIYTDLAKDFTHIQLIENSVLSKYMDFSNFDNPPPSLINNCTPCQLGYLKSEVGCNIIFEVVALAAKLYSILSKARVSGQSSVKSAVKGCPSRIAKIVYNHQAFLDILFEVGYQIPSATCNQIRRNKAVGVETVTISKTCLTLIENKRWWGSFNFSLAWAHPDIPPSQYQPGDILADRGAFIKDSIPNDQVPFQMNDPITADIPSSNITHDYHHDNNSNSDSPNLNIDCVNVVDAHTSEIDVYSNSGDFFDADVDGAMNVDVTLSSSSSSSSKSNSYNLNLDCDNAQDFYTSEINEYSDSGDFFDTDDDDDYLNRSSKKDKNEPDIYNNSFFEDYNLENDVKHHRIKMKYNYINKNVDEHDFICYTKDD